MAEESVVGGQRARVAEYADRLSDIAAIQEYGRHVFVAACISALARLRVADYVDGESTPRVVRLAGSEIGVAGFGNWAQWHNGTCVLLAE